MNSLRVLVADDHDLVRSMIAGMLRSMDGVEVVAEVRNGAEAVREASRSNPDFVLLDVHMPEQNGYEASREIKSILPDSRVAIMTVASGSLYEEEARRSKADAFLSKDSLRTSVRQMAMDLLLRRQSVGAAA